MHTRTHALSRTCGTLILEPAGFTVERVMECCPADGLRMHPLSFTGIYHSGKNSKLKMEKKLALVHVRLHQASQWDVGAELTNRCPGWEAICLLPTGCSHHDLSSLPRCFSVLQGMTHTRPRAGKGPTQALSSSLGASRQGPTPDHAPDSHWGLLGRLHLWAGAL